jgi:hypothetical protein
MTTAALALRPAPIALRPAPIAVAAVADSVVGLVATGKRAV